jgi:hypothetical protein
MTILHCWFCANLAMASSQKPNNPSPTDPPQQNSSATKGKGIESQSSSDGYPTHLVAESSRRRRQSHSRTSDSDFRPSSPSLELEKETEKRLSQVAPKRGKGKEIVKEERPWEAKNILSFGKHPWKRFVGYG